LKPHDIIKLNGEPHEVHHVENNSAYNVRAGGGNRTVGLDRFSSKTGQTLGRANYSVNGDKVLGESHHGNIGDKTEGSFGRRLEAIGLAKTDTFGK